MDTYQFPKRGELRALVAQAWPEKGHKRLIELVVSFAECEIAIDALPSYLALAIETYCEDRGGGLRLACYATLPPLIRTMVTDQTQCNLVLNEYVSMLERLNMLEH